MGHDAALPLIVKSFPVDRLATAAVSAREIAALAPGRVARGGDRLKRAQVAQKPAAPASAQACALSAARPSRPSFRAVLRCSHEARNHPVKSASLVVERLATAAHTLLTSAKRSEIFRCLWVHLRGDGEQMRYVHRAEGCSSGAANHSHKICAPLACTPLGAASSHVDSPRERA